MAAVQVAARIDKAVLDKAGKVFAFYGLDVSSAIRMFITTTANEGKYPIPMDKRVETVDDDREFEEALHLAGTRAGNREFNERFMAFRGIASNKTHAMTGLEQQLEARNEWPD
jgi:addiction module RelB/DinJ family antitoxin